MAPEFPRSVKEAQKHIQEIRRQNNLDIPGFDYSNLENALRVLSEDLYEKPTHFLQELIQNADDNEYNAEATPTMLVNYTNRVLQVSCNERGFSKSNVEALCKIGQSTKSGSAKNLGYTGEKGLGFKSIFKVSNVVWIRSGQYSFKFDKNCTLGMLAPAWAEFPGQHIPGFTSIRIQILPEISDDPLLGELQSLDPRLLVFLRRLQKIVVTIDTPLVQWSTTIRKDVVSSEDGEVDQVTLRSDSEEQQYAVLRHTVENLPFEHRRQGTFRSVVTLGFPVIDGTCVELPSQHVYAFLPIRDFGFKFLLNADFILSASRETIIETLPWNRALRDSLPEALLSAVQKLRTTDLQYRWPLYLPVRPKIHDFFQGSEEATFALFRQMPVLETTSGELDIPINVKAVPSRFCDDDGRPMVVNEEEAAASNIYLSSGYDNAVFPLLERLGVVKMSAEDFLVAVKRITTESFDNFINRPESWHSRLASQLSSILATSPDHTQLVKGLPLIPLVDGRWVSAEDGIGVFANPSSKIVVPAGADISQIEPKAVGDRSRELLFRVLRVGDLSTDAICDAIAAWHERPSFDAQNVDPATLVSHVAYMYQSGWNNPRKRNLWFTTAAGSFRRGSEMYVDSGDIHSTRFYIKELNMIHSDYLSIIEGTSSRDDIINWLIKYYKVSNIPRIVDPLDSPMYQLSMEFRHIMVKFSSERTLLLLRDNWHYYKDWILPSSLPEPQAEREMRNRSRQSVFEALANMQVVCRDGQSRLLRRTTLPRRVMIRRANDLDFLDVPDPEKPEWDFLLEFGVKVQAGMSSADSKVARQIDRLQDFSDSSLPPPKAEILQLYREIDERCLKELEEVRTVFRTRKLIWHQPVGATPGRWYTSAECYWSGDMRLQKTPTLKSYFPELQSFFVETLQISIAGVDAIVSEILQVDISDPLSYIIDLFHLLQRSFPDLDELGGLGYKPRLLDQSIFPILNGHGALGSKFDALENGQTEQPWRIADRPHLRKAFEGIIPLLSVPDKSLPTLRPVLECLGLWNRRLSGLAERKLVPGGKVSFLESSTTITRRKVPFLARVIPCTINHRKSFLRSLVRLQIYETSNLMVHWSIKGPSGAAIPGRPEYGRGKIFEIESRIEIWITKAESANVGLPIDVIDELVKLCGDLNAEATGMLHYILMVDDLDRIEDYLERKGITADPHDDWITEELLIQDPRGKCPQVFGRKWGKHEDRIHALNQLERNKMSQITLRKQWEGISMAKMKPLLKAVCLLEKQDPSMFLPTSYFDDVIDPPDNDGECEARFNMSLDGPGNSGREYAKTTISLPGVFHVSQTNNRYWDIFAPPGNSLDDELMFFGELHVSMILERHLGSTYIPDTHWTSSLRTRAGMRPYNSTTDYVPAFTIEDSAGSKALHKLLIKQGLNLPVAVSASHLKFHIDVVTVEGELNNSTFFMHPKHFAHIQTHCLAKVHAFSTPTPVIPVLIAVCCVKDQPTAFVLPDPFALYLSGTIRLSYSAHLCGAFNVGELNRVILDVPPLSVGKSLGIRKRFRDLVTGAADGGYQYQPLPSHRSIRVLDLAPANSSDAPLKGLIRVVSSLDATSEYDAVSYAWGVALKPYCLETPEGSVWMTASCDSALRSVRAANRTVSIWIDAVCIDQNNKHEKAIQVRLMGHIFQTARHVHGFLGDEGGDSELAITTLLQIRSMALAKMESWPSDLAQAPESFQIHGIPPESHPAWMAIDQLFDRSWFRRAWVTQEVVLAKDLTIICGTHHVKWSSLYDGLKHAIARGTRLVEEGTILRSLLQKTEPANLLGITRRLYDKTNGGLRLDFLSLVDRFTHTEAGIELDKLFALVGLASDTKDEAFNADYESPLKDVIYRYAAVFVNRDRVLDLLSRAGSGKSYPFASWIPRWTGVTQRRTISTWRSRKGRFSACGKTGLFSLIFNEELLQIMVTFVDTITQVGNKTGHANDLWSVQNENFRSIQALEPYPTGEPISEVQRRLPIGDASRPYFERPRGLQVDDSFACAPGGSDWVPDARLTPSLEALLDRLQAPTGAHEKVWKYWQTVSSFSLRLSQPRFASTERRYAGLVPRSTRPGDLLGIVHGASVPFILRKIPPGGHLYQLVGECYVHGIMHGEAMAFPGVEEQIILIR